MPSPNQMEVFVTETITWIRNHQEKFWAIVGTTILSLLFVGLVIHHRQTESQLAWFELGTLQGQLMQDRLDETRKGLSAWETRFKGTDAATYAKFIKADLLYRTSDFVQASQIYSDLAATGSPAIVRPLALSAQASSEEMAGNLSKALDLTKTFMDLYPDHFLSAPRYVQHARLLEMTGDKAGAAAVYNKFVLLYPQSPWTDMARARAAAFGTAAPGLNPSPIALPH